MTAIFDTINRLWRSKKLSRSEKDVLIFLSDHTAKHPTSHISMASIASVTLTSPRTVAYAISKGEALGIVVRVPHRALRGGKVCKVENSYRFHAQPLMSVVSSTEEPVSSGDKSNPGPRRPVDSSVSYGDNTSPSMCKMNAGYSIRYINKKAERPKTRDEWLELLAQPQDAQEARAWLTDAA